MNVIKYLLVSFLLGLPWSSSSWASTTACFNLFSSASKASVETDTDSNIKINHFTTADHTPEKWIDQNEDSISIISSTAFPIEIQTDVALSDSTLSHYQMSDFINYKNRSLEFNSSESAVGQQLRTNSLWARLSPFMRALVRPFRDSQNDPHLMLSSLNLNFLATGQGHERRIKMFIETTETDQLTKKWGHAVRFEADIEIPKKLDWVNVRLADFRLNDSTLATKYQLSQPDQNFLRLGFKFPKEMDSKNSIKIKKEIQIDFHFLNEELNQFIDHIFLNPGAQFFTAGYNKNRSAPEIRKMLKDFFANMKNPAYQNRAVEIVSQGLPSINHELAKYNWVAQKMFNSKTDMLEIIIALHGQDLFYESGAFAEVHGGFAHHAQILAGLEGLPLEQRIIMLDFISRFIAASGGNGSWPLWNALFDSRSMSVNGNRFWRDLINRRAQ